MTDETKTARIRKLNDQLRTSFGTGGRVVLTRAIAALEERVLAEVVAAVQEFDAWSPDKNDAYGEHDFLTVEVQGHVVFAKVDYYDLDLQMHSPDPADPEVTRRILTVGLMEEY